ncbi:MULTISPECIES: hypothetical protein [unclassified Nocardia]|uniref:hypothetical protein n=1 Tax=unclassified Nocardia TaxID=2637762 RepID=UPI0033B836B1
MTERSPQRPNEPIASSTVVEQRTREVLDHFGTCPRCGYAEHAFLKKTAYADGRVVVSTVGLCGLPCGWSGPTTITKMNARDHLP